MFQFDDINIIKITVGDLQTNCYIVFLPNASKVVVIDPGADYDAIVQALEGKDIDSVILTHGHFDHMGAVDALAELYDFDLYVHEEDDELLKNEQKNCSEHFCANPFVVQKQAVLYTENTAIYSAGITFKVMHTPGHTKGSSCLYVKTPRHNILFTGDTLFKGGYGRTDLYGGSFSQMVKSARRLLQLEGYYTCFSGHGEDTSIGIKS
ncbi:MAG: MBL fold metallo-hydrolase [Eubacteriales bacterium]|nr:MBL fold metallo-hydrolase [Eubacteriales bacterium]